MKYMGIEIDDKQIDRYVAILDCSIIEACDAILCDRELLQKTDIVDNRTGKPLSNKS